MTFQEDPSGRVIAVDGVPCVPFQRELAAPPPTPPREPAELEIDDDGEAGAVRVKGK